MRGAWFLAVLSAGVAATQQSQQQKSGPGTQTVLLIKGGVGFDVNLISQNKGTTRRERAATVGSPIVSQAADLKTEQRAAEALTKQLKVTVSSANKIGSDVKSLRQRVSRDVKALKVKDHEISELKKTNAKLAKASDVQHKMLFSERHRADLLEQKVKGLEADLVVSNRAWRNVAEHEKVVAAKEESIARDALAKSDRLSSQQAPAAVLPRRKRAPPAAPAARPRSTPHMPPVKAASKALQGHVVTLKSLRRPQNPEVADEEQATLEPLPDNSPVVGDVEDSVQMGDQTGDLSNFGTDEAPTDEDAAYGAEQDDAAAEDDITMRGQPVDDEQENLDDQADAQGADWGNQEPADADDSAAFAEGDAQDVDEAPMDPMAVPEVDNQ